MAKPTAPAGYGWMEPGDWRPEKAFLERYGGVLAYVPPGARVLDCACGTGSAAIALARRGFRVEASDPAASMVAVARERAIRAGVRIGVRVAGFTALPTVLNTPFDAVFCAGNAIAHARAAHELVESLRAMCAVLSPGGTLALDVRDAAGLECGLADAGLDVVDWQWDADDGAYTVTAERPRRS